MWVAMMEATTSGLAAAVAAGRGVPFLWTAVIMRELVGRLKVLRHAGRPLQVAAHLNATGE